MERKNVSAVEIAENGLRQAREFNAPADIIEALETNLHLQQRIDRLNEEKQRIFDQYAKQLGETDEQSQKSASLETEAPEQDQSNSEEILREQQD